MGELDADGGVPGAETFHETRGVVRGPAGSLETLLTWPADGEARDGILICSPSPLLGGDMENNVTEALARAAAARGLAALRWNYRNVGRSHDDTDGQPRFEWWNARQEAGDYGCVLEDAQAALAHAGGLFQVAAVVGYSFGAWIALQLARRNGLRRVAAVLPPLGRLDFDDLADDSLEVSLVVGGADVLDPPPPECVVRDRFPAARLTYLADCDHFVLGREELAVEPALALLDGFDRHEPPPRGSAGRARLASLALLAVLASSLAGCSYDDVAQGGIERSSPERCGQCHVEVYAEWSSSGHARAYSADSFAAVTADQSFARCLPCHAPDSIYTAGALETRDVRRAHGVDCIACHLSDGVLVGPFSQRGLVDPHPVRQDEPTYRRSDLCGICHEQTFEQWRAAPEIAHDGDAKPTCQACHMPPVQRTLTQATGATSALIVALEDAVPQRQHRFDLGGLQDLGSATSLSVTASPGGFVLQLENHLPHSLPTGQFGSRIVLARIDFQDAEGRSLGRGVEHWSVRRGTAVPAGGTDRRTVLVPAGTARAVVELLRPRRPGSIELTLGQITWRAP